MFKKYRLKFEGFLIDKFDVDLRKILPSNYFIQYRDPKTFRFTKFRRNKWLVAYVYKKIKVSKLEKEKAKVKIEKIKEKLPEWIRWKDYFENYLKNLLKMYKGYVVAKPIELFYHTDYEKDLFNRKYNFVYKEKIKLPYIPSPERYRLWGDRVWIIGSVYFCFVNDKNKKIIFHRRNVNFQSYVSFDELIEIMHNYYELESNKLDYGDLHLVAITGYLLQGEMKYGKKGFKK
jgi:hypothetical protein